MKPESTEGNLQSCVYSALGHADWTKFFPALSDNNQRKRVEVVEASLRKVAEQVRKLRETAAQQENAEILAILDEVFEFPKFVPRELTGAEIASLRHRPKGMA